MSDDPRAYIITSRVHAANGVELAITNNGEGKPLTLTRYTGADNQKWYLEPYDEKNAIFLEPERDLEARSSGSGGINGGHLEQSGRVLDQYGEDIDLSGYEVTVSALNHRWGCITDGKKAPWTITKARVETTITKTVLDIAHTVSSKVLDRMPVSWDAPWGDYKGPGTKSKHFGTA